MADFHQTGAVATLHRLVGYDYGEVERRLIQFSGTRKTTLILPSLQVNMRAGEVPKDKDGRPMLKLPVNAL